MGLFGRGRESGSCREGQAWQGRVSATVPARYLGRCQRVGLSNRTLTSGQVACMVTAKHSSHGSRSMEHRPSKSSATQRKASSRAQPHLKGRVREPAARLVGAAASHPVAAASMAWAGAEGRRFKHYTA